MLDPEVIRRIRHIFLQPWPHVSIWQATDLLGWTLGEMKEAIAAGEVELMTTPISRATLAGDAVPSYPGIRTATSRRLGLPLIRSGC